ncbi:MAG: DUF1801 domain-containing protein, partial [Undibacterium sp.]|nr:DUF1801 domain-containing protein [Undibacterium sp.]
YKEHVSLEFGRGNELNDQHNVLEGKGKFRRHIKLHQCQDLEDKQVKFFLQQAYQLIA